ncbi:TIGR02452 family protein [Actinoplanes sp. NEAU-A12]|uniref:TIGR02452 family protein n=1 Tax=Actinoplanes sandaracinus TaxID=3045177 RepID=A0ABT6WWN4_9ACTN|nr:TIGR02452 family protein [Actinoplanes sandaracinus]MDI6104157.1 TIGR02452 family protein [Actinoplanes sandaracinus]
MSRELRALARDTLEILDAGHYVAPRGGRVALADRISAAVAGTKLHVPGEPIAPHVTGGAAPVVEVTRESTLAATRRLAADGDVAALVFASAKNPGGGFRTGAQAQEESLARAAALYPCLTAVPEYYNFHRAQANPLYSDRVIYSPRVPVFRDDDGRLLDAAYEVSFLTAAAPNRGAVRHNRAAQVATLLAARARRVLTVAAVHGHRRLVLGAWGCGVFRNDPSTVADAFADALGAASGWFDHVVFAVMDHVRGAPVHKAFAARFPAELKRLPGHPDEDDRRLP